MDNKIRVQGPSLHTLIPLEDFKALLGVDDREDKISRFCLITATFTIEQYCRRSLLVHRHFERFEYAGDLLLPLREYPVREVLAVYACCSAAGPEPVEPEFYTLCPELEERLDIPHTLRLSPALGRLPGVSAFKAVYRAGPEIFAVNGDFSWPHAMPHYSSTRSMFRVHYVAGYRPGKAGKPDGVPPDLASACLELAAWNMSRYRGRRIGMTGNVRGSGKDGEHLETSMPENVRLLLEPYKRRVI